MAVIFFIFLSKPNMFLIVCSLCIYYYVSLCYFFIGPTPNIFCMFIFLKLQIMFKFVFFFSNVYCICVTFVYAITNYSQYFTSLSGLHQGRGRYAYVYVCMNLSLSISLYIYIYISLSLSIYIYIYI